MRAVVYIFVVRLYLDCRFKPEKFLLIWKNVLGNRPNSGKFIQILNISVYYVNIFFITLQFSILWNSFTGL